ncbi:hypothetical protein F66182_8148 [Fusarium sp. NRRL 66182]|nr:hypothetical protein F66182_8148 [Fusarium sp. NRRL 66182]
MKKLPFKPTALRRAAPKPSQPQDTNESDDDGLALFQRSKEMAPIMAADLERRLKKHRQHREAGLEAERRKHEAVGEKRPREDSEDVNHSDSDDRKVKLQSSPARPSNETPVQDQPSTQTRAGRTSELVTPPPSKRSRLGSTSDRKPILSVQLDDEGHFPDASPTPRQRSQHNPSLTPSRALEMATPTLPSCTQPLPNDSDSERPNLNTTPCRAPKTEKPILQPSTELITIDSDSESDSDVVAAKAPSTRPGFKRSSSIDLINTKSSNQSTPLPAEEAEFADYIRKAEQERARMRALEYNSEGQQEKKTITILITSAIPDASGLRVKFLFNKALRAVREAWVKHQSSKGLFIPTTDIVLTWRKKRVYNTSTLLSLGIRPAGDGGVEADGFGSDGFGENRTVVHMEAWTPELFQEMERNEELRRRRDAGELSDEDDRDETPLEDYRFRIFLKGRDMEPFPCRVTPETITETLITVFRQERRIGTDKEISLWWDGERLEEHVTLDEAEIEEMDTIEVHVQ